MSSVRGFAFYHTDTKAVIVKPENYEFMDGFRTEKWIEAWVRTETLPRYILEGPFFRDEEERLEVALEFGHSLSRLSINGGPFINRGHLDKSITAYPDRNRPSTMVTGRLIYPFYQIPHENTFSSWFPGILPNDYRMLKIITTNLEFVGDRQKYGEEHYLPKNSATNKGRGTRRILDLRRVSGTWHEVLGDFRSSVQLWGDEVLGWLR